MTSIFKVFIFNLLLIPSMVLAQDQETVVKNILDETYSNSQLEQLAFELMDEIGPRLVGSPQMQQAHDWAVAKFKSWNISAENQQYGELRAWERGITHIDMVSPRVKSIQGMQLALSAASPKKGITAEAVILPENFSDSISFAKWLPNVKGKLVLTSMPQLTGRPDYNWEEFATPESLEKMKKERDEQSTAWNDNIRKTGYTSRTC